MQTFEGLTVAAQRRNATTVAISLDLRLSDTPLPHLYADEPLFPVARDIIAATADLVCAYAINPAFYMSEGAAGMVALERIVRAVPKDLALIWNGIGQVNETDAPLMVRAACEQYGACATTMQGGAIEAARRAAEQFDAVVFLPSPSRGNLVDCTRDGAPVTCYESSGMTQLKPIALVSRRVIYASKRGDFAQAARAAALALRAELVEPQP